MRHSSRLEWLLQGKQQEQGEVVGRSTGGEGGGGRGPAGVGRQSKISDKMAPLALTLLWNHFVTFQISGFCSCCPKLQSIFWPVLTKKRYCDQKQGFLRGGKVQNLNGGRWEATGVLSGARGGNWISIAWEHIRVVICYWQPESASTSVWMPLTTTGNMKCGDATDNHRKYEMW